MEETEKILKTVMDLGGTIEFTKPLFINSWKISKIKACYFTENVRIICELEEWNAYVNRIYTAIGAKDYCVWVRNEYGKMVGILAFYTNEGKEIKMQHEIKMKNFHRWNDLIEKIDYDLHKRTIQ